MSERYTALDLLHELERLRGEGVDLAAIDVVAAPSDDEDFVVRDAMIVPGDDRIYLAPEMA